MDPKVSIILLNWNGWEDTIECLESLYQINYTNYNVILVDNHSEDESIKRIREYLNGDLPIRSEFYEYRSSNKPIRLIENGETPETGEGSLILLRTSENLGFAGGNNVGIDHALENLDPDYVLLLNNDTVVDKEFLDELVKTGESKAEIGFVGAKTLFYDREGIIQEAGGGMIDYAHAKVEEIGYNEVDDGSLDSYIEPDYIGGACVLVKTEVIKKIGGLDPNYFMYWEDVDWCTTGLEEGYKSAYQYQAVIRHKYGSSSQNTFKIYYLNRNRLYFMKKHTTGGKYLKFLSYFVPFILFETTYQLIRKSDSQMAKAHFYAMLDGFKLAKNPIKRF
jgi:GT2 family glycosyltransferase